MVSFSLHRYPEASQIKNRGWDQWEVCGEIHLIRERFHSENPTGKEPMDGPDSNSPSDRFSSGKIAFLVYVGRVFVFLFIFPG